MKYLGTYFLTYEYEASDVKVVLISTNSLGRAKSLLEKFLRVEEIERKRKLGQLGLEIVAIYPTDSRRKIERVVALTQRYRDKWEEMTHIYDGKVDSSTPQ